MDLRIKHIINPPRLVLHPNPCVQNSHMKNKPIREEKILSVKLILNKCKGKSPKQNESVRKILRKMLCFSISRLILSPFPKEINTKSKIIHKCLLVPLVVMKVIQAILIQMSQLWTCIGTNNTYLLSRILYNISANLSIKIINSMVHFKLGKYKGNKNPQINLKLNIHKLSSSHCR